MMGAFDTDFAHAVRAAARGNGQALRDWLLSDKPLGSAERGLMADFLCRDPENKGGRPPKAKLHMPERLAAVIAYRREREAGQEKAAASIVAEKYGVRVTTLRGWDAEFKGAENDMKDMNLKNWQLVDW